ncbi:hypothetical protein ACFQAT_26000 [Undibacterium arcticum]|uniref:HTH cro/C1-type domain-containing protein n=1 Tax=Undibacterium arcticum TaxID=1762892 RepID=A0ABV7F941_9BURK
MVESDLAIEEFRKEFSRRLEMLVEARGYPKTNFGRNKILAKQLEVTPAYVYKLFHGQMGSTLLLPKIAKTLNTTTDFLLGLTDVMDRVIGEQRETELIVRHWHPIDRTEPHFDLPVSVEDPCQRTLKGMWAYCRDIFGSYDRELVIYDVAATQLVNRATYLVVIDDIVQLRTATIIDSESAMLWFEQHDIFTIVPSHGAASESGMRKECAVLGTVVARTKVK